MHGLALLWRLTAGGPERLRLVMEGESLLNDASSFTLFSIFFTYVIDAAEGHGVADSFWHILGSIIGRMLWLASSESDPWSAPFAPHAFLAGRRMADMQRHGACQSPLAFLTGILYDWRRCQQRLACPLWEAMERESCHGATRAGMIATCVWICACSGGANRACVQHHGVVVPALHAEVWRERGATDRADICGRLPGLLHRQRPRGRLRHASPNLTALDTHIQDLFSQEWVRRGWDG
jgi:hypothetical protein